MSEKTRTAFLGDPGGPAEPDLDPIPIDETSGGQSKGTSESNLEEADIGSQIVRILNATSDAASKANRTGALPGYLLCAGFLWAVVGPAFVTLSDQAQEWFTPGVAVAGYLCGTTLALAGGVLALLSHVLPVKWDDTTRQGAVEAAADAAKEKSKAQSLQDASDEQVLRLMRERHLDTSRS